MIHLFNFLCFICFAISVIGLILHSFSSVYLSLALGHKKRKNSTENKNLPEIEPDKLPLQVIQLPVYNEDPSMVKALIESAGKINYPHEKLIIQLLDDSDREELSVHIQNSVNAIKTQSPQLQLFYLHRGDRHDYKAGNLNFGLHHLKKTIKQQNRPWNPDEIIVSIFDADYLIPADYLNRIVKHFSSADVGIVQTSTTFRNSRKNALTKAQTVFQDNLHNVELSGRSQTNHLSSFRGSAGSLRLTTIIDSGYWQGDTQIEDTDLSFAAQSRGWKIIYDNQIICSSLLPESYNEFKLQQRSWMKGLMEVMRKRLAQTLDSKHLSPWKKILSIDFFLVLSLQAIFLIFFHLAFLPTYFFWPLIGKPETLNALILFVFLLMFLTHVPFFVHEKKINKTDMGNRENNDSMIRDAIYSFGLMAALFVTFAYGLAEGLGGSRVHRDRTGKGTSNETITAALLTKTSINILKKINLIEIIMALYSIGLIVWALLAKEYIVFLVYVILAIIYPLNALLSYLSIRNIVTNHREN